MTSKNPNKRPRPSYEEGQLRDPAIEQMQRALEKGDLQRLIKKAVQVADKPRKG